jgi:hypothetical protein
MTNLDPSVRVHHRRRRPVAALALAGALLLALAPGSAGATTSYTVDVSKRGDFVAQTNFVQCVGASMQMMLNMIEPGRDRTASTQLRLQKLARAWSGPRPDGFERQGASVRGWASGLNIVGGGPYRLIGTTTLAEAVREAAKAISSTGRPVGLLMWRGRHAWVMSGFTATANPNTTDDFRVTRAIVHDPLYPHGSAVWGPSPRPGEAITVGALGRQFVRRSMNSRFGGRSSVLRGKYVLVLPYEVDLSLWSAAR